MAMVRGEYFGSESSRSNSLRRLRLHEQLRLEVEAGRETEIGVGRPREAIDAAVLAAAIGIDRTVERDVGGVVAGDDLARRVDRDRGLEQRQLFERLPAVVECDPRGRLVAARGIRLRAASAPPLRVDGNRGVGRLIEVDRRGAPVEAARRRWQGGRRRRRRAFQGCRRTSHGNDLIRHCEQNKNNMTACWQRRHLVAALARRHRIWWKRFLTGGGSHDQRGHPHARIRAAAGAHFGGAGARRARRCAARGHRRRCRLQGRHGEGRRRRRLPLSGDPGRARRTARRRCRHGARRLAVVRAARLYPRHELDRRTAPLRPRNPSWPVAKHRPRYSARGAAAAARNSPRRSR